MLCTLVVASVFCLAGAHDVLELTPESFYLSEFIANL